MSTATKQTTRLAQWYRSIAHGLFYLLTFLLPVFLLPWTLDPLEVNKQTLLVLTVSVAMIAWLGAMVIEREVRWKTHWWWLLVAGLCAGAVISAIMSPSPFLSWIGQGGQEYTSILTLISFVGMLLIGSHTLSETVVQRRVLGGMIISAAIVTITMLMQLFSWGAIDVLGTPYATALYLTIMTVVSSTLWLVHAQSDKTSLLPSGWGGGVVQGAMLVTIVGSTLILLALDFWLFWVLILVGMSVVFVFALLRSHEFPNMGRFVIPMALLVVSLLFLFVPSVVPNTLPFEVSISYGHSWDIATETLAQDSWAFGSGPGTFTMDYAAYRSADVNNTVVWDQQFDRSASHLMTMLATFGVLPTLLYVVLILVLAAFALHQLMVRSQRQDEWKMTFVVFGGWLLSVVGQVFYPSNMTLSFLFWLLTAILVSQVFVKESIISFTKSSRVALVTTFGFVIMNVVLLTMLFVSGARYSADVAFARAVTMSEQGGDLDDVIEQLLVASRFNRWSDVYQRNLAQAYLGKTAELVADSEAHPAEVEYAMTQSITSAQRAVELSPNNLLNWTLLGDVYREIAPLISGADVLAIEAYSQAIALAPSNPKYYAALARAYVVYADQLAVLATSDDEEYAQQATDERVAALESAIVNLEEAIALKPDYATAYYYLALSYERAGNISEAIDRMVVLRDANPYDVGIAFQLGLLYLQQGKIDEAQGEFERAVTLSPEYANAYWYLSAIYEEQGDVDTAIEALETILQNNPGHEAVLLRIEQLQSGAVSEEEEELEPLEDLQEGELISDSETEESSEE